MVQPPSDPDATTEKFAADPDATTEKISSDPDAKTYSPGPDRPGTTRRGHVTIGPPRGDLPVSAEEWLEVRGVLGEGGLGRVLDVRDPALRRNLAMKTLKSGTTRDDLARFVAEAQVTAQLDHPNIVPIHQLGRLPDGSLYYTMKRIEGLSLDELLRRRKEDEALAREWSLTRLVELLVDAGNALAYAHARGVIHRDVKPQNIMSGPFGEVLVVDWGLARVQDQEELDVAASLRETQEGDILGTPVYMPPEQACGDIETLGPASDVYALGATLFRILTGRAPFSGRSVGEILRKVQTMVEPPVAEGPPELVAVCRKAMARAPEARYPDAGALVRDLRNWLEGRAVAAAQPNVWTYVRKWLGRHRGVVAVAIAGALALLGASGWYLFNVTRARDRARTLLDKNRVLLRRAEALARARTRVDWGDSPAVIRRVLTEGGGLEADAAYRLEAGRILFKAGDLREAIRYLEPVAREGGEGAYEALFLVYLALWQLGETDRASEFADLLKGASASGEERLFALLLRSDRHYRAGEYKKGLQVLDEALELGRRVSLLRQHRAIGFLGRGDLEAAEREATLALRHAPDSLPALTVRGRVRYKQKRFRVALQDFNQAVSLAPNVPRLLWNRAICEAAMGNLTAAESDYEKLRELTPDSPDTHFLGALVAAGRDETKKAKRLLSLVPEANFSREHVSLRAILRFREGAYEAALEDFGRISTRGTQAELDVMVCLLALGRREEARVRIDRWLDDRPNSPAGRVRRGLLHLAAGRLAEALEDFRVAALGRGKQAVYGALWFTSLTGKAEAVRLHLNKSAWPVPVADYLAGRTGKEELLRMAGSDVDSEARRRQRLCVAHAFVGLEADRKKERRSAIEHYRAAVETECWDLLQHIWARHRLRELKD